MFEYKSVEELVRILAAGGGFAINAGHLAVPDLIRMAAAASGNGARLQLRGVDHISTEDLVSIGAAGSGCVEFLERG